MEQDNVGTGRAVSTQDLLAVEPDVEEESNQDSPTPNEEAVPELFTVNEVTTFRADWQDIQTAFVDDPKSAVREADELVAAVIQSLAATFAEHKSELESQWSQGEAPTEDLRIALRRYRSFFNQLLSN
ncbi:MAG: hypothetical protein JWQ81_8081 [Amycolatopsis sp.]|jgi:hypothetical protein|nr:hypothetical protein [Amycolatopsis sp.]